MNFSRKTLHNDNYDDDDGEASLFITVITNTNNLNKTTQDKTEKRQKWISSGCSYLNVNFRKFCRLRTVFAAVRQLMHEQMNVAKLRVCRVGTRMPRVSTLKTFIKNKSAE
jgi:hypothetical protein